MQRLFAQWRAWRAFRHLPREQRGIVFYAESGQDWHHLQPLIDALIHDHDRNVCYLTSDPDDPGLQHRHERLQGFCIGGSFLRILAFQFLRADVFVLTMMDLGNMELKRSIHSVHYVYLFHSPASTHMVDNADSYDHYDTLLCAGPHQVRELRRREEQAGLRRRELVEYGYPRLDDLLAEAARRPQRPARDRPTVLVAPTWGEQALLELHGEALLGILLDAGIEVILRPHYETERRHPHTVQRLLERFGQHPNLRHVDRMGDSDSLFDSDLLITDWSGIGIEYPLALGRPVLFVDVPRRVRNPDYEALGLEPVEVAIRERVGEMLAPSRLADAPARIRALIAHAGDWSGQIEALRREYVFNPGDSVRAGANAIARIADERAANPQRGAPNATD